MTLEPRRCLREPIPEIEIAAEQLDEAVSAHLLGRRQAAASLLRNANSAHLRDWLDSLWGKTSIYTQPRRRIAEPPILPKKLRSLPRDATRQTKRLVHGRDGFYCRFCNTPVIRSEVRAALHKAYPDEVPWGNTNATQHAAFQVMWAQYDHIVPHQRGGRSDIENVVLTCAGCNYGRNCFLLEELDLLHPLHHPARAGAWDGLERMLISTTELPHSYCRVSP